MRRRVALALLVIFTVLFSACESDPLASGFYLYYLDADEMGIHPVLYTVTSVDIGDEVEEVLAMLSLQKEESDDDPPIPPDISVISYELGEGNLSIHFSNDYKLLTTTREALLRAAVVKTMTQLEGIDTVRFFIGDDPLTDTAGNIISAMNSSAIIEDFGAAQESMAITTLALYYSNESGSALIREERTVHYNSNVPLEQVIFQYLAMAPQTEGARSIFASGSKVINVVTSDGTCYVDLDAAVLAQENSISNDVLIYSIVDSLTELPQINHVYIKTTSTAQSVKITNNTIDGTYDRDLSIVLNEAEAEN